MLKSLILAIFILSLCSAPASAGLLFTYRKLITQDLDKMNDLVQSKIKEAKKSSAGRVVPIKECVQAVFSRPNEDGMIGKVFPPLRNELERMDKMEKVFRELTEEALNALKNHKNFSPEAQVTYAIFLENFIAEFRPMIKENSFEKKLIEKIAEARVELTNEAVKERKKTIMKESHSPSEFAVEVLKPQPEPAPTEVKPEDEAKDELID